MTKVIKSENWKEFFDELSRAELDSETTVQVLSDETGAQYLSEGLPFVGLTFDEKDNEKKIELIVGSGVGNHQTHNILNPKMVAFESEEGKSGGTLDIEDESGTKTLIKFTQTLPMVVTYSETEVISTVSEALNKSKKIMNLENNTNRVAIIGCKNFSAENLYSLLMNGAVGELVLVEEDCEELLEEISALQNSIPLDNAPRVFQGGFEDAATHKWSLSRPLREENPGESPMNLLGRNVKTVREIAKKLNQNDFDGVILVVANPADILAQVALEESGLPANKVIGSGKVLDDQSEDMKQID